jgi:HEAT repeat protein
MLEQAFDALKTFDYGADPKALRPIDEAVVKCHGDDAARAKLEEQLAAVLAMKVPHAATDYVCRKLMLIGSAACVPALAELLSNKDLSHLARYALERIPGSEASAALRKALGSVKTPLDIGMISSLSARGDSESVSKLGELVGGSDAAVAKAAADALGIIGSGDAAAALAKADAKDTEVKIAVTDAKLSCAENLVAAGKKGEALKLYKSLSGDDQPKHVALAAKRGVLACLGSKAE